MWGFGGKLTNLPLAPCGSFGPCALSISFSHIQKAVIPRTACVLRKIMNVTSPRAPHAHVYYNYIMKSTKVQTLCTI